LTLVSKGTGGVRFNVGNGSKYTYLSSDAANNFQLIGVPNTANLGIYSSGGGSIRFYTASGLLQEQLRISPISSAVNFIEVTGATTGGSVVIYGNGSDTNVSTTVSAKGFSSFINFSAAGTTDYKAFAVSTSGASNTGNYLQVKGNASGTAPVLSAQGADTNVDITFTTKGTGVVQFGTHTATADTAISGYITIKDSGGTLRKLAVIT
jgi:hypothetical protein